jgi:hypothetical protein
MLCIFSSCIMYVLIGGWTGGQADKQREGIEVFPWKIASIEVLH